MASLQILLSLILPIPLFESATDSAAPMGREETAAVAATTAAADANMDAVQRRLMFEDEWVFFLSFHCLIRLRRGDLNEIEQSITVTGYWIVLPNEFHRIPITFRNKKGLILVLWVVQALAFIQWDDNY